MSTLKLLTTDIVDGLVTTDFIWNKYGISTLLGYDDIMNIHDKYKHITKKSIKLKSEQDVEFEGYKHAKHILELGRGHVSICGGGINHLFYNKSRYIYHSNDLDFYFHSFESVEEATSMLMNILGYLDGQDGYITFYRNEHVITCEMEEQKYQFILRFYENRQQILHGFDLWGCQIGYDLDIGIFAIPTGAFAMATKCMIVDLTKCSTSYATRLNKYQFEKDFQIFDTTNFVAQNSVQNILNWARGNAADINKYLDKYDTIIINSSSLGSCHNSDYDEHDITYLNWYFAITKQYDRIIYAGNKLVEILSPVSMKESILDIDHFDPVKRKYRFQDKTINSFFPNEAEAREFKMAYFVDRDKEKYSRMWNEKLKTIREDVQKHFAEGVKWNVKEPTTQRFGQNNPIILNPKEFYANHGVVDYTPKYAGIKPELWLAIAVCRKKNPMWQALPRDVFYMLMKYICIAHYKFILQTVLV